MNSMEERGDTFENKFFYDEDLRFIALAHRNRLIGLWVANSLGKSGDEAEAYAKKVIIANLQESSIDNMVHKIMVDFRASGIAASEPEVRKKMASFMQEAIVQTQGA